VLLLRLLLLLLHGHAVLALVRRLGVQVVAGHLRGSVGGAEGAVG
jgi:hypothetical protein